MVQKAKKLLGVDYGEARTGLAYSDDLGLCAIAMGNVKSYNREKAAKEIALKAAEIGAELIVIGKPLNMDGTAGERFPQAVFFVDCSRVLCYYMYLTVTDERRQPK